MSAPEGPGEIADPAVASTDRAGEVRGAFDGSTLLYRGLHALGWGPLLNLGYYRVVELPMALFGLAHFQRRLALQAVKLLDPRPDEVILDVGCGHGWSTAQIAGRGARAIGLDLVEDHVEDAHRRYPNLEFVCGSGTAIPSDAAGDASVDAVLCLEMAFQIDPAERGRLLEEVFRVLRPGGRLVLVDFAWRSPHPEEIEADDPGRLVRDTWRFEQFEPHSRYLERAERAGLRARRTLDWSRPVTARFQMLGNLIVRLGRWAPARSLLLALFPGLPRERGEWEQIGAVVRAHDRIRRHTRYLALEFEKPH